MYAFSTDVRSSRRIECHCRQDVAYRVITGNLVPDHATIARFIDRHRQALAGLFGEGLRLCERAGLVESGVVSIDGTRIAGNASPEVNYTFEQIAMEIVAETVATDAAEDEELGERRGDELPEQLRTPEGRRGSSATPAGSASRSSGAQSRPVSRRPRGARRCRSSSTRRGSSVVVAKDAMRGCERASASSSSIVGGAGPDVALARGAAAVGGRAP